jgi:hypothetical protein
MFISILSMFISVLITIITSMLILFTIGVMASNWFNAMAGGCVLGLIILNTLEPIDFNIILLKRLKKKGVFVNK